MCSRVIRASKDLAGTTGSPSVSFDKYCALENIHVEEQQFCYDTNGIKNDVKRLLDLGAETDRICRKVKMTNADFCATKTASNDQSSARKPGKRGIIYE